MKNSHYIPVLFVALIPFLSNAQCPLNLDFETGTKTGWQCLSGSVSNAVIAVSHSSCRNPNNEINPPLRDTPNSAIPSVNQQAIVSTVGGVDPNSGLPVVAPGGGNYSLRIGDGTGSNGAPATTPALAIGVRYTMQVTPQNTLLTYMYAALVCEADGATVHTAADAPRFEVLVKNAGGNTINCGSLILEGSNHVNLYKGAAYTETIDGSTGATGVWWYSKWTNTTINLNSYIGQAVTLEFRVSDCNPMGIRGGHGAYAYIDAKCGASEVIKSPAICANTKQIALCAPAGSDMYKWEQLKKITGVMVDSAINSCITVKNPAIGEIYKVTYKLNTGCDLVIIDTLKGLQVNTLKKITLCPNQTPIYQLKADINVTNKVTYVWSSLPAGFTSTLQNPVISTPAQNTRYAVTVTDSINGCSASDTVNLISSCELKVTSNNATVCAGNCALLTATVIGVSPFKYKWQPNNLEQAIVTVCPTVSTIYTLTVTDSLGATASTTATITANPLPDVKLTPFNVGILTPASPGFDLTGGTPVGGMYSGKGVSAGKFDPASAGVGTHIITYSYTNDKGCSGSATQTIVVSESSGTKNIFYNDSLSIYPNPYTQNFTIETVFSKTEHARIQLVNLLGEVVSTIEDATVIGVYKKQVNAAHLPSGIYFLSVKTTAVSITKKLIKN